MWASTWIYQLAEFFDIASLRLKYPPSLGFLGRKRAVDFNDTTLETFKLVVPPESFIIRAQDKEIVMLDKGEPFVKMDYGGLDDTDTIKKFNSAEYCFVALDQAEETQKKDVSVLQASLRLTMGGKKPPYKELYTANPAECWLKDDFVHDGRDNGIFIPALPDDNPYLPDNYKQTLRSAFEYDPALLRAYLEGDWDAFSNLEDALFFAKDFEKCKQIVSTEDEYSDWIIAVDVATKHGDCSTVLCVRHGHEIVVFEEHKKIATTQIVKVVKERYEKHKAHVLVMDSDGFGEGAADVLASMKIGVTEFHGGYGHHAFDQRRYRNLRSQFFDVTTRKLAKGLYGLKNLPEDQYKKLKSQCCTIKVRPPDSMARMQVETKEDMKARQVKSPDYADAFMMSEYGLFISRMSDLGAHSYR